MKKPFYTALFILFVSILGPLCAHAASADKKTSSRAVDVEEPRTSSEEYEDQTGYKIGPQNLLQVKIFGEAGVNQLYRVDEEGYIKHALGGRIRVGGMNVTEVERTIEAKLDGDYIINPQVNVFVLEYSHFSVLGEVRKPGNYEITGTMSVIRAISMAGGFTPIADQRNVQIIRTGPNGTESKLKVDVGNLMQGGQAEVELQADDVIVVPKSFF